MANFSYGGDDADGKNEDDALYTKEELLEKRLRKVMK